MNQCNPIYDIHERIEEIADEFGEFYEVDEMLLINCHKCGHAVFYRGAGIVNDVCECCGATGLHKWDETAYTVAEYWGKEFAGYDEVESFNL